jgi:hypothetical protein
MIQITFSKQNKVRLFPTLPGKHENDFVRVAQNRFHKKTVIPLCRRLKQLFIKQRIHSLEISAASTKTQSRQKPIPNQKFTPSTQQLVRAIGNYKEYSKLCLFIKNHGSINLRLVII